MADLPKTSGLYSVEALKGFQEIGRGGILVIPGEEEWNLMEHLQLKIDGMSCGHCVARVEKALKKLAFGRIREALDDAGYTAHPVERGERVA
jgi:hypothetical protein